MPNDSSTGGFLTPSSVGGDLNDDALVDFLQTVVVGITALPGAMVRPRWQPEAPDPPDPGTNWAAIGLGQQERDFNAFRKKANANTTLVIRNRVMEIICSFYGPNSQAMAELLANGIEVPQNRETMQLQGIILVGGVSSPTLAPAQFKGKWYPKFDVSFRVRQQQRYTYTVLDLTGAQATLDIQPPGEAVIVETLAVSAPQ